MRSEPFSRSKRSVRSQKKHGVLFHTDAVQAYGQLPINVDELHIDMLSSSGHKLNGPKGIGFLYIRKGVKIRSFVHGGAQERKRRAGTENVPGIVGYGKAAEIAAKTMKERTAKRDRTERSSDRPCFGGSSLYQIERTQNQPSAEQCKLQFSVCRR